MLDFPVPCICPTRAEFFAMRRFQLPSLATIATFVAVLFLAPVNLQAKTKLDWDPEHTWVFAVGILEWEHSDIYPSFPAAMKNRRDKQLVDYFREAGVPKEQITYLQDAAATKRRVERE